MDTDTVLLVFAWLFVHPSTQAVIGNAISRECPYNCHHHGDCHVISSKSVVSCDCHIGWGGDTCDLQCDRPCLHGKCVFAGPKQVCMCSLGFKGQLCSEPGYDMEALLGLARTIMSNSDFHLPLVEDPRIEVEANIRQGSNVCVGNFVCRNGGRCVNGLLGGYKCQCDKSKHTGNFCQYTCPKPCQNGGTCVRLRRAGSQDHNSGVVLSLPETQAVYRCVCLEDFTGERCQRRVQNTIDTSFSVGS